MTNNIFTKLAVASAGAALSFAAIQVKPALAATATYDFTVDNLSGPLSGQTGSGSFSYDDSSIKGSGQEFITLNNNFKLNFNFLGQTYTEANDIAFPYPDETVAEYVNGKFNGLFYRVSNLSAPVNNFEIDAGNPSGNFNQSFRYGQDLATTGNVTYTTSPTSVPEPRNLGEIVLALGIALLLKKKAGAVPKKE